MLQKVRIHSYKDFGMREHYKLSLLSSLWDKAIKDRTECKACSKVLSQPEWKPSHVTNGTKNPMSLVKIKPLAA